MFQEIKINNIDFVVLDAREGMTVPDCFVKKNKIGSGHGEAKFYIGNDNDETWKFFDDFNRKCIVLRSDLLKYLVAARPEYKHPEQPYVNKKSMPMDWENYWKETNNFQDEVLGFTIEHQKQIEGSRVYINSSDKIYEFIRIISLPNITYLSALKLKGKDGEVLYYFKLFLDYFGEIEHPLTIQNEEDEVRDDEQITQEEKEYIVKARKGQGKYRDEVLEECPFCPITMISDDRLLIASHIKPWVESDNKEKTDPKNGFMLTPTYDFLFDRGYISFNDDKTILISPWLSKMTISKLSIAPGKKYGLLPSEGRENYLKYHRENIFKK